MAALSEDKLRRLLAITHELGAAEDVHASMSRILRAAASLTHAHRCTLFLADTDSEAPGHLYVGLSRGWGAEAHEDHTQAARLRDIRIPIDRTSIAGYCACVGVSVCVSDAYADPRFDKGVDAATSYRTHTILAVPLKNASGHVVAVLQAVNKLPEGVTEGESVDPRAHTHVWPQFNEEDTTLLTTISDFAGSVLSRLVLADAAAREKARSDQLVSLMRHVSSATSTCRLADVVDAVIDAAYRLLHAQRVTLFLVDESRRRLVIASSKDAEGVHVPLNKGLAGYCATTGGCVVIPDAYKDPRFDSSVDKATGFHTKSVVCVPIRDSNGDVVGVLQAINRQSNGSSPFSELDSPAPERSTGAAATRTPVTESAALSDASDAEHRVLWPFTPADVEVLEGLAAHAAVALRTTYLMEEMSRSRTMTTALLDIVQTTASDSHSATVSVLVQKIVDAAYKLLDCERVSLYLVDAVKNELWLALAKDLEAVGARIPIGQGLAGWVAASGQPLNISDAYRDNRFDPSIDLATGFRTRSVMVWPIAIATGAATGTAPGSSVIAVLQAINKRSVSLARVASSKLLRSQSRLGSLFSTSTAASQVRLPSANTTTSRFDRGVASTATDVASPLGNGARFDANDERVMGAFCAEVAVALKRRSVEAAFMKVLNDTSKRGEALPDEFNVSLLALYTDAGTSARLHTSVTVRRVTVERNISWPTGLRLLQRTRESKAAALSRPALGEPEALDAAALGAESVLSPRPSMAKLPTLAEGDASSGERSRRASLEGPAGSSAMVTREGFRRAAPSSTLSLAASRSSMSLEDAMLSGEDSLFTWNYDVFKYPLTALPASLPDPLVPASDSGVIVAGNTTVASLDPALVAIGEERYAMGVLHMFQQFSLLQRFNIDEMKFVAFIHAVRSRYLNNPFHNPYHAFSVLHATFLMIGTTNAVDMLTYRDILAALIAAYGHDIDHPGHGNAFEVNSYSPLALMHNDDAVLERHHAHTLFQVLFDPKYDILEPLSNEDVRGLRTSILRGVLGTDMSKHFGSVQSLAARALRHQERLAQAQAQYMESKFGRTAGIPEESPHDNASVGSGGFAPGGCDAAGLDEGVAEDDDLDHADAMAATDADVDPHACAPTPDLETPAAEGPAEAATSSAPAEPTTRRRNIGLLVSTSADVQQAPAVPASARSQSSSSSLLSPKDRPAIVRSFSVREGGSGGAALGRAAKDGHARLTAAARTKSTKTIVAPDNASGKLSGSAQSAALKQALADILPFDRNDFAERDELLSVIVHTADLSGQAYPLAISRNWSNRVLYEFRAEAAASRAAGLPVLGFMKDLDQPLACAQLQLSFVTNIVLPLWKVVAELLPGLQEPVTNLQAARLGFEADAARCNKIEAAARAGAVAAPAISSAPTPRGLRPHVSIDADAPPPSASPAGAE